MCQSNYLEISRAALRQNAAAVRNAVPVPIIGVIKCNGYGVTACEAASAWRAVGITMFGVSRPEEALDLRKAGFKEDILLMCPVADIRTLWEMVNNDVILTVSSFDSAYFYMINGSNYPIRVHIAVDTGMGRFGIRWNDVEQVKAVYALPGLSVTGIFSHFSSAFKNKAQQTKLQLSRFLSLTNTLKDEGIAVGLRHIANSCAAFRFPETHLDAVRIGSALVGRMPVSTTVKLERVSIFKAQVVDCKRFFSGETTGYGSYFKFKKSTNAVIVAIGREDGFGYIAKPDKLQIKHLAAYIYHLLQEWITPPCVFYNGQKLKMIGRIGNQYTLFDAAGTGIKPGDMVEWDGNLMYSKCERRFV